MRLYLAYSSALGGGGFPFQVNMMHFVEMINTELEKNGFTSTFDEFCLTLLVPPPKDGTDFPELMNSINKKLESSQVSRIERKNKRLHVNVPAPEFAEYVVVAHRELMAKLLPFSGKKSDDMSSVKHEPDLTELESARLIIGKYMAAGEILGTKISDTTAFDHVAFKRILLEISDKLSEEFIGNMHNEQRSRLLQEDLQKAITYRNARKQLVKPGDTLIRDFRVYSNAFPAKVFSPYDYQYSEIFLNLLQRKQLKCPGYHHLYIQIAATMEGALRCAIPVEKWHANGAACIDYEDYLTKPENEKEQIVFNAIAMGLRDLADIDHLDPEIINSTITEIQQSGLQTELFLKRLENEEYRLTITYFSESFEKECPVFFNITEKKTGRKGRKLIGRAMQMQLGMWLQKVKLTKTKVQIKAGFSIRAAVWLKEKPRSMEFSIQELLDSGENL